MEKITKDQLKKIHVMLNQMKLMEYKADLIHQFTNNRTEHSSEMTIVEAKNLLHHLTLLTGTDDQASDRMRKKVFAQAYEAGIIYGHTPDDKRMNSAKLNSFLKKGGAIKKKLNEMSHQELVKVVNQFAQIIKHQQQTGANKATRSVLDELNIQTEKTRQPKPLK